MASESEPTRSKKPSDSPFKQQTLPAWQPILTPKTVIPAFFLVGLIFVPLGVALFLASRSVVEASVDYTSICHPDTAGATKNCSAIPIVVTTDMQAPIYVYYGLTNYYQNHRRYVKSRNDAQLRGNPPTSKADLADCAPRLYVNSGVSEDDPNNWWLPCGLIAWSRFNDSFTLSTSGGSVIPWTNNGIAWASDINTKFRDPPSSAQGTRLPGLDHFNDPDFVVWMRTAGLPNFRKLHRIISQNLPAGTYYLDIKSSFPVQSFGGTKSFVLSTTSWVGGKNDFLGLAYIIVGGLCLVLGIAFLIAHKVKPRELGDQKYLVWQH